MAPRTYPRIAALSTAAVVATWGLAAPAGALPGDGERGKSADAPGQVKRAGAQEAQDRGKAQEKRGNRGRSAEARESRGKSEGKRADQHAPKSGPKAPAAKSGQPPRAPQAAQAPGATKERGAKGAKGGDPAGNNGTVKIALLGENDGIPNNSPHPGCTFQVEWYGFDQGDDIVSEVSFASHAPTSDATFTIAGDTSVPVGGDAASGAGTDTGLDGVQQYTLDFTGEPHPKQGYHVKMTVSTPYSQGNDTKSKVFWVEPCETTTPPPPGTDINPPPPGTETETDTGTLTEDGTTPDQGVLGTFATADDVEGAADEAAVAGTDAEAAAAERDAAVPTAVDAGDGNPVVDFASSPAGLLLIGLGLALSGAGVVLRRRGTI